MWIRGNEVVGARVQVGEVAPAAAGDSDLFANPVGVLKHNYFAPALGGFNSAEQTSSACADYDDIFLLHVQSVSRKQWAVGSEQKAEGRKQKAESK